MNHHTIGFRLGVLLVFALTSALGIAGSMYWLLRHSEDSASVHTARLAATKDTAYELLETLTAAQNELQHTLRLKDPDEIERSLAVYRKAVATARKDAAGSGSPKLVQQIDALTQANEKVLAQV